MVSPLWCQANWPLGFQRMPIFASFLPHMFMLCIQNLQGSRINLKVSHLCNISSGSVHVVDSFLSSLPLNLSVESMLGGIQLTSKLAWNQRDISKKPSCKYGMVRKHRFKSECRQTKSGSWSVGWNNAISLHRTHYLFKLKMLLAGCGGTRL